MVVLARRSGCGGGSGADISPARVIDTTEPGDRTLRRGSTRSAIISDSRASIGGTLNSSICSRAAKTASIRRRLSSGGDRAASCSTSARISSLTISERGAELHGEHVAVDRDQVHQTAVDDVEVPALGPGLLGLLQVAEGRGVLARTAAPLDHAVGAVELVALAGVVRVR